MRSGAVPRSVPRSEKPSGASAWRTKRVFTLKQAQLGAPIAQSEYAYAGGGSQGTATTTWYHYDVLGNVVAQTGMNGEAVALFEQEAYGNVLSGNPAGLHVTGKEFDPMAGLYYFGARWYDPRTGRWIEKEPTGADGPNLYWYGRSNPAAHIDPDGRSAIAWPIVIKIWRDASIGAAAGISGEATEIICGPRQLDWGELGLRGAAGAIGGVVGGSFDPSGISAAASGAAAAGIAAGLMSGGPDVPVGIPTDLPWDGVPPDPWFYPPNGSPYCSRRK